MKRVVEFFKPFVYIPRFVGLMTFGSGMLVVAACLGVVELIKK